MSYHPTVVRAARRLVALALVIGLLAPSLLGHRPAAAQTADPYDLAATLLPLDAFDPDAYDLDGDVEAFGLATAGPLDLESAAIIGFSPSGTSPEDAATQAALEDAGWVASHRHDYWAVTSVESPELVKAYRLVATQFEDADGAEAAFELFEGMPQADTDLRIGDDTLLIEGLVPAGGPVAEETLSYILAFVTGDIVATVHVSDVSPDEFPDPDEIEPLAEAMLERVEAVQEGDTPGLGTVVQRVELGDDASSNVLYRRIDGEDILRWNDPEDGGGVIPAPSPDAVYIHQQTGSVQDGGEVAFAVTLYAYGDEADAVDLVADGEGFLAGGARVEDVRPVDSDGDVGDGSVAFEVTSSSLQGRPFVATSVLMSVGTVAAQVRIVALESEEAPPLEAVEEMARAQADCLDAGECPDVIAIADVLAGGSAGDDPAADEDDPASDEDDPASDEDDPAPDDEDAASGVDGDTYESPTYGYTVQWDEDVWSVEDEGSRRGEDTLELTTGASTVLFTGTDAYEDAEDCLDGAVEDLLDDPSTDDFSQAVFDDDEPYEGEGRLGPFTGYTDGETGIHIECAELPGGDGVLLVTFTVSLVDFLDEAALFDDLLRDVEI